MKIYVVALVITLILTSCMSPQEQLDLDRRTCLSYGYGDSSETLAGCIKSLQMQRKNITISFLLISQDFWIKIAK